jgi:hypothetical protein
VPRATCERAKWHVPNGAFGTGGTLASKHRKIFTSMISRHYDLFVNQEDDIIIKPHNFRYFMQHATQAHRKGWYLYTMESEVSVETFDRKTLSSVPSVFLDWRAKRFDLITADGQAWMDFHRYDQRKYMLTRSMLH